MIEFANGMFTVIAAHLAHFVKQRLLFIFARTPIARLHHFQVFGF
jgi:hypothetical protein